MKSLTAAAKERVTEDWAELFPGMGIYKPLRLLSKVGPLLIGILLERDSSNISYRPTFHVHSLTSDFREVSLTMSHMLATERTKAPETIDVDRHEAKYHEAAQRLSKQAPLPLSGDLRLSKVLAAYEAYLRQPTTHFQPNLYEDMALISAWLGQAEQSAKAVEKAARAMGAWPEDILEAIGGLEQWRATLQDRANQPGEVRAAVERRIDEFDLGAIPGAALLPG